MKDLSKTQSFQEQPKQVSKYKGSAEAQRDRLELAVSGCFSATGSVDTAGLSLGAGSVFSTSASSPDTGGQRLSMSLKEPGEYLVNGLCVDGR